MLLATRELAIGAIGAAGSPDGRRRGLRLDQRRPLYKSVANLAGIVVLAGIAG
ncbi:hypothetical protein [Paractinoplanes maris]|uniref:hypothetical protein n=1 Tax=Paractinoplanes maris TaxID=1734446 RepID=UPI0020227ECF|nr:hypothetical protein [Actinoplanes maris]